MRTELTASQTNIVALATELDLHASPGSELRLESKGRLYAKSGKRHTDGKSKSRLTYQERGAAFLREGVRQSLRERGVTHLQSAVLDIMAAARPWADERANEPHRYLVRHGQDMAHIIQFADQLVNRGLEFEPALERVIGDWANLSRLEAPQRQKRLDELAIRAVPAGVQGADTKHVSKRPPLATAGIESLQGAQFERKSVAETPRLTRPDAAESRPQSAAQAARDAAREAVRREEVQWHASASAFDNRGPGLPAIEPERKHGPRGKEGAVPGITPSPTGAVVIHASPDSKRMTERAGRRLNDILEGGVGADYLVEQIGRDEVPHLAPLMHKKARALMDAQGTVRDSKAQVADWQAWRNLARFCGEACIDDGAGAHAFTRADVLKFPLEQRLNMLAALDDAHPLRRGSAGSEPAADQAQRLAILQQSQGLSSAFSDKELLPPSDEVRANALKARLHAISANHPGAAFSADMAQAVIQAHHEAYQLTGKPLEVVRQSGQAAAFLLSEDRRTLHVSAAPRPADESPAEVVRQLVVALSRTYQVQLVERMNNGALEETDDRFMLAAILQTSQGQQADVELLASTRRQMPAGAPSRHARLHAARTVRF